MGRIKKSPDENQAQIPIRWFADSAIFTRQCYRNDLANDKKDKVRRTLDFFGLTLFAPKTRGTNDSAMIFFTSSCLENNATEQFLRAAPLKMTMFLPASLLSLLLLEKDDDDGDSGENGKPNYKTTNKQTIRLQRRGCAVVRLATPWLL